MHSEIVDDKILANVVKVAMKSSAATQIDNEAMQKLECPACKNEELS